MNGCIRCGADLEDDDCRYCRGCCDILASHKQASKPPEDLVSRAA